MMYDARRKLDFRTFICVHVLCNVPCMLVGMQGLDAERSALASLLAMDRVAQTLEPSTAYYLLPRWVLVSMVVMVQANEE